MSHVDVTDSTFQKEVLEADKVTLVDFWASWCMPCQMLGPILDEVGTELGGAVKICKVNVDENQELSGKYNIMSIPAVYVFKDGHSVEEMVGLHPKEEYIKTLKKYIESK
jgi:thioredoxin 1